MDLFWKWEKENDINGLFSEIKSLIIIIFIFLVIPLLIYYFIILDPVIGFNEDGEPKSLGFIIFLVVYYICLYFSYKKHQANKRLNQLLDKILDEDGFKSISDFRKKYKIEKEYYKTMEKIEKKEERIKWFNIE